MDEMYELLKDKLQAMREDLDDEMKFSYLEVSKMYQLICMMKQMKEIIGWCE